MTNDDLKRDHREDLTLFEGKKSRIAAVAGVAALVAYTQLLAGDFAVYLVMTVALFVSHGVSFVANYIIRREYAESGWQVDLMAPYWRSRGLLRHRDGHACGF